jgi:hypothetical protein
MKVLTRTRDNGMVIEFSFRESNTLAHLIYAVEGKVLDEVYVSQRMGDDKFMADSYDLSNVFEVISAFYQNKFRLNELEQGLKILKNSLENPNA